MKEEQVQIKLLVPISVKESIKKAASQKSLTMTDYLSKLHQSNITTPITFTDEQTDIIRDIGLHLLNIKQSLLLDCTKLALIEVKEALEKHETLI